MGPQGTLPLFSAWAQLGESNMLSCSTLDTSLNSPVGSPKVSIMYSEVTLQGILEYALASLGED